MTSLINIGFGNMVAAEKVVAIVSPESAPIKRIIQDARERGALIDATYGRRTRAVIVMDDEDRMLELVNPEIIHAEGEQEGWEGCLSVPNQYGWVNRPSSVTVRAQDRDGNFFEVSGEEMVARCFCHELEHLDGHMYDEHTDRLYTAEELDEILAQEEDGEQTQARARGQRRRRRRA